MIIHTNGALTVTWLFPMTYLIIALVSTRRSGKRWNAWRMKLSRAAFIRPQWAKHRVTIREGSDGGEFETEQSNKKVPDYNLIDIPNPQPTSLQSLSSNIGHRIQVSWYPYLVWVVLYPIQSSCRGSESGNEILVLVGVSRRVQETIIFSWPQLESKFVHPMNDAYKEAFGVSQGTKRLWIHCEEDEIQNAHWKSWSHQMKSRAKSPETGLGCSGAYNVVNLDSVHIVMYIQQGKRITKGTVRMQVCMLMRDKTYWTRLLL